MKIKSSNFVSSVKIAYISEEDEKYDQLKKFFDLHGYAFITNSVIFVDVTSLKKDNFFKKNHLLFIEAHEIAHLSLSHSSTKRNKREEAEADYIGILLCKDKNMKAAAGIGKKYFSSLNGISFKQFDEKYGEELRNKIM